MKTIVRLTQNELYDLIHESTKTVLSESYGIFNGCEDKAREITKRLFEKWNADKGINNEAFYVAFKYCNTGILWIVPTRFRVNAAYILDKKKTNGQDVIIINPRLLYNESNDIEKTLTHELTHVYEDDMRTKNGISLPDYAIKTNFDIASRRTYYAHDDDNDMKDEIAEIMTYLSTFEVNATLASLYHRVMHPYVSKQRLKTVDDVLMYIYDTREYNILMNYANTSRLYAETQDEEDMNNIVETLNELTRGRIKTKRQARGYFMRLCNRTENQVNRLIPKLVNKYFEENNLKREQ